MPEPVLDLRNPEWLPTRLDRTCRTVDFVHVSEKRLRSLPFLDWRYVPPEPRSVVSLEGLVAALEEAESRPRGAAYVFHTSFCGSTLLARALDRPRRSVAYKEPPLLTWLARLKAKGPLPDSWPRLLHLAHRLHSRVFDPRERAVVKAHNGCSNLLADMLRDVLTTEDCVVFLYGSLDSFLARVLDADDRRQWVHQFLRLARRETLGGAPWPQERLTESQETALLWAMHILDFREGLAGHLRASVCAVSQEMLWADLAGTIRATAALMELGLEERDIAEQLEKLESVEAKTGSPFSLEDYLEREVELQRRFRPQILEARKWLIARPWGESVLSWPPSDLTLHPAP